MLLLFILNVATLHKQKTVVVAVLDNVDKVTNRKHLRLINFCSNNWKQNNFLIYTKRFNKAFNATLYLGATTVSLLSHHNGRDGV